MSSRALSHENYREPRAQHAKKTHCGKQLERIAPALQITSEVLSKAKARLQKRGAIPSREKAPEEGCQMELVRSSRTQHTREAQVTDVRGGSKLQQTLLLYPSHPHLEASAGK